MDISSSRIMNNVRNEGEEEYPLPKNPFDTLDDYLKNLVKDSPSLIADLSKSHTIKTKVIEFYAEVPEQPDPSLYIGLVTRWHEVVKYYNRPVRVYTYVYNTKCEKYLYKLTSPYNDLQVTVLPGYLRKAITL